MAPTITGPELRPILILNSTPWSVLNFLSYYNPDYAVELVHLLCNIVETMESNKPVLTVGMVNYWGSPNCIDAKTVVYWVKAALGELK